MSTADAEIPTSTFKGVVKQLSADTLDATEAYALDLAFPLFRALDQRMTMSDWAPVFTGLGAKVFYVGRGRERRYAGDRGLERGRYFSVCDSEMGDDQGTLRNELMAYYGYESRLPCAVFDSTVGSQARDEMSRFGHEIAPFPHILLRVGPKESNPVAARAGLESAASIHLQLPLTIVDVEIPGVFDLRYPDAQAWFFEHFISLEREYLLRAAIERNVVVLNAIDELTGFADVAPVLLSPELGGGHPFVQGTGAWLRAHGVNALVYPSARTDCHAVSSGTQLDEWAGWNMVYFEASAPVNWEQHFGHTVAWTVFLGNHVRVVDAGKDDAGASGFRTAGLANQNHRRFLRQQQLAVTGGHPGLFDLAEGLFWGNELDVAKLLEAHDAPDDIAEGG
jgi:hypothetical protein